ncbi:DDE_3 domain-containing protein [Trichonephila clavipes]|nr:DDE_3 domain-containing protein [Trichonephila clavipes]
MNPGLLLGQMITVYGCGGGGGVVSGTIPLHFLRHTAHSTGVIIWGSQPMIASKYNCDALNSLMGQRYVDDILRPHVGPFLNGLPGVIFQQNNARPHTARVAQDFLRHF